MDEKGMRALLERIADDPLPPAQLSVEAARGQGHRLLRRRRFCFTIASPVAAALAVALIASLPSVFGASPLRREPSTPATQGPSATPKNVPVQFIPQQPYARFGWLPAGISPVLGNPFEHFETLSAAAATGIRAALSLQVFPRGDCRLSGPRERTLSCKVGGGPDGVTPTTDINGRPAYWASNSLWWEYGPGAWAVVSPDQGINAPHKWFTQAQIRRVAAGVRFGYRDPIRFGFTYNGVIPSGWRPGSLTVDYLIVHGRPISIDGAALANPDGSEQLDIQLWPAGAGPSNGCPPSGPNESELAITKPVHVTLDGAPALVYTVDGYWLQTLCAKDVHGVYLSVSLTFGDQFHYLQGIQEFGGALGFARHLRLLGPDWTNWVSNPWPIEP